MAIATAVCCAFVGKKLDPLCSDAPQYYLVGYSTYMPAGEYGYDFDCDYDPAVTCTYYKPDPVLHPDTYATCNLGSFINLDGLRHAKAK